MEKVYEPLKIDNLKDMLNKTREIYKDNVAYKLKTETKGEFKTITHGKFRNLVDYLRNNANKYGIKEQKNCGNRRKQV